ncbi:non-homologous end joining protein Ku [Streptomyces caniscabiei]|uniref:Non-homologous end joining protein Ku n=1 Tax=Streptomyces caniscabiei TaxID=2746961 RepID=A0A927KXR1_9ACTN|nr:Ku protein [Streptomyces caniscabiei]MBD9722020.1 Ku protein [Streptomyces caniscabiei]
MPAIWSGAISFGLVTIPVRVVTATENHTVSFRQVHVEDGGRIRYRKVCELDGQTLTEGEIGKAYEWSDRLIPVTDEELADMPLPTAKAIEIVAFVPAESIDPIRIGAGYYLAADGPVAGKPYVLLRKALERSSKVAVAKFALRGRERLGLLRIRDDAIVLHAMHWDDEIRDPAALAPPPVEVEEEQIERALLLIDSTPIYALEGEEFADRYTEALEQVIEAKREGRDLPSVPEPAAAPGQVVDLMAALEESVAKARTARGGA